MEAGSTSPGGGGTESQPQNQVTLAIDSSSTLATDVSQAQQSAQDLVSPSMSGSSSSSSSPTPTRPNNLPLEDDIDASSVPQPPPRTKKKKSRITIPKKSGKCVDLRGSSQVPTSGFTSMMKKFRKPLKSRVFRPKSAILTF